MARDRAADLHTEIRRLRVRVAGLSSVELDRVVGGGARGGACGGGEKTPEAPITRRQVIRAALAELSALSAEGRPVPELADRVLSDQLVVLLQDCLPEFGAAPEVTSRALGIAEDLRRALG